MTIAVISMFRNMAGYPINRYFGQIDRLGAAFRVLGLRLALHLGWGDCEDQTRQELENYCAALQDAGSIHHYTLVERSHGGPVFGSTEEPERLKALSFVVNGVLETIDPSVEAVIYVESDLLWEPGTWIRLLGRLQNDVDVAAPLTFAGQAFYDTWGFRDLVGHRYGPFYPYNDDLKFNGDLTEVGSIGSNFVMRGAVARACRIRDDYSLVGLCRDIRAKGFRIYVDPKEKVNHP